MIGAQIGARLSLRVSARVVQRLLAVAVLIVAIRLTATVAQSIFPRDGDIASDC